MLLAVIVFEPPLSPSSIPDYFAESRYPERLRRRAFLFLQGLAPGFCFDTIVKSRWWEER
jgi:hypothetical protein